MRVLLADECYLVPKALGGLLSTDPGVRVVGLAAEYDSVLGLVGEFRPDVVVTDVRMPPSQTDEGIRLAAALRASYPGTGVVVLSQYAESAHAIGAKVTPTDPKSTLEPVAPGPKPAQPANPAS